MIREAAAAAAAPIRRRRRFSFGDSSQVEGGATTEEKKEEELVRVEQADLGNRTFRQQVQHVGSCPPQANDSELLTIEFRANLLKTSAS